MPLQFLAEAGKDHDEVLGEANALLRDDYKISLITIQVRTRYPGWEECTGAGAGLFFFTKNQAPNRIIYKWLILSLGAGGVSHSPCPN